MALQVQKNFSNEVKQTKLSDKHLELVGHPILRQVISEVLSEELDETKIGSSFGEGGP
jgi:hypothetical protein